MVKEILTYDKNKNLLIQKSEEVTEINDEIKNLIQDLKDTLAIYGDGVGISAIQIGVPKRVCIVKYNNQTYTLINPVITRTRGEIEFIEGCLSVPDTSVEVKRAQKVWCLYKNENGYINGGYTSFPWQAPFFLCPEYRNPSNGCNLPR